MEDEFNELFENQKSVNLVNKKIRDVMKKKVIKSLNYEIKNKKYTIRQVENTKPIIKINKNGEIVQSIEITCSCGEKISIDLVYEENES